MRAHFLLHWALSLAVLAGGLAAAFWVFGLHALIFGQAGKSDSSYKTVVKAQDTI